MSFADFEIFVEGEKYRLFQGDCLTELLRIPRNTVDALVTDPPAGIGFMGKEWDTDRGGRDAWVAWLTEVMREAKRVMKPGAHGFVWALPRTSHWTATTLENAGFEVRDCVYHLFGSGFPKSLDVSKAIDRAAVRKTPSAVKCHEGWERPWAEGKTTMDLTAPATDAAKQWAGWGTALKPAVECWWLVRKPLSEKTVAANVLKWRTGALNIDGGRIDAEQPVQKSASKGVPFGCEYERGTGREYSSQGRFPSHLILDEEAGALLDAQSGTLKNGGGNSKSPDVDGLFGKRQPQKGGTKFAGDTGGASRFFYTAKPSRHERDFGVTSSFGTTDDGRKKSIDNPYLRGETERRNRHPTVKPFRLMRYLLTLVTPPGGVVLDPFMGSGTTGSVAIACGWRFIGIDKDPESFETARARIRSVRTGGKKIAGGAGDGPKPLAPKPSKKPTKTISFEALTHSGKTLDF